MIALWLMGAAFTLGFMKNEYTTPNVVDNILVFTLNLVVCIWIWPFVLGMYIRDAVS